MGKKEWKMEGRKLRLVLRLCAWWRFSSALCLLLYVHMPLTSWFYCTLSNFIRIFLKLLSFSKFKFWFACCIQNLFKLLSPQNPFVRKSQIKFKETFPSKNNLYLINKIQYSKSQGVKATVFTIVSWGIRTEYDCILKFLCTLLSWINSYDARRFIWGI